MNERQSGRSDLPRHRSPREHVIWPTTGADDGEELRVAAPEGCTREEVLAELDSRPAQKLPMPDVDRERAEQIIAARKARRFSLFEMMVVVTLLAVLLAVLKGLPIGATAGLSAIATAVGTVYLHYNPYESRIIQIAWFTTFLFSVVVSIAAVIIGV